MQGIVADGTGSQLAPVFSGVLDLSKIGGGGVSSQGVAPAMQGSASPLVLI